MSSVNNPEKGLQRIWKHLNEKFRPPEMRKVASFSRKGKNYAALLADILTEIEFVKEVPKCQPLLEYNDSTSK